MKTLINNKTPKPQKGLSGNQFPRGWLFLTGVAVLYVLVMIINHETAAKALSSFLILASKIAPVLGVVMILLYLFNLFKAPQWINHHVGKNTGLKGWLIALIAGIISVGPIYPWYLILGDLKQKGMRPSLVAAFFYSRAVKLPLLPLMLQSFGFVFTATLISYILLFAIVNGVLIEMLMGEEN
jgi:hypothetical protein